MIRPGVFMPLILKALGLGAKRLAEGRLISASFAARYTVQTSASVLVEWGGNLSTALKGTRSEDPDKKHGKVTHGTILQMGALCENGTSRHK